MPPGRFWYSNAGYQALGMLLERLTGEPYQDDLPAARSSSRWAWRSSEPDIRNEHAAAAGGRPRCRPTTTRPWQRRRPAGACHLDRVRARPTAASLHARRPGGVRPDAARPAAAACSREQGSPADRATPYVDCERRRRLRLRAGRRGATAVLDRAHAAGWSATTRSCGCDLAPAWPRSASSNGLRGHAAGRTSRWAPTAGIWATWPTPRTADRRRSTPRRPSGGARLRHLPVAQPLDDRARGGHRERRAADRPARRGAAAGTPAEDGGLPASARRTGAPSGCASTPRWTAVASGRWLQHLAVRPDVVLGASASTALRTAARSGVGLDRRLELVQRRLGRVGVALAPRPGRRAIAPAADDPVQRRQHVAGRGAARRSPRATSASRCGGQDQRQRDGAVQQVGAQRLAGGLRVAVAVEHVVGDLEGQAERLGEAAERRPGRRRPARPGGRPASPRRRTGGRSSGVQRSRYCSTVVSTGARLRALQDLAAGQRQAGVGEHRHRRHVAGLDQLGERPGEQVVAGGRRDRSPSVAQTVGRPRRSGARSSWSSCTSVAMCTSSTAQPAITRLGPVARGRRRTGRRAAAAAACRRTSSVRPPASATVPSHGADGRAQPPLDPLDEGDVGRRQQAHRGTVPDVHGDDAQHQPPVADRGQPGVAHDRGQLPGAGEARADSGR